MDHSMRIIMQLGMNVLICKQASKSIAKIATKKGGTRAIKPYLLFVVFTICLIGLNQGLFFFFKPLNLYQELQIPRSMPAHQIINFQNNTKLKIIQNQHISLNIKMQQIKKLQDMVQVLTHPARRLSYDTFGETDTSFAWAFKSQGFLLSTVIGSSIFYVMCTFLNMVSEKKGQIKQVLKLEIMVMILLFLWELDLIMKTQERIHQPTDLLDKVFKSFPMFERREMIKVILVPCMNIIKFFYRFYVRTGSEKKFLAIAKNPKIMECVKQISEKVRKLVIDERFEDRVQIIIKEESRKNPLKSQIYGLIRQVLTTLMDNEGDNIFLDEETVVFFGYYMIRFRSEKGA